MVGRVNRKSLFTGDGIDLVTGILATELFERFAPQGLVSQHRHEIGVHFPYIASVSYEPTRIVNDKIYDIAVRVEVLNPLADLDELTIKLIPVEYEYFITKYGMRREDYPLVFPPEKTRIARFKPKGVKTESFKVEFKDLVGGREYLIEVEAKNFSGNVKRRQIKTSYIRQFENFGKELYKKGIIVSAVYLPFNMKNIPRKDDDPLLGRYDTLDPIVSYKHVDWATGHGINVFIIDSQNHWWPEIKNRVFTVFTNILNTEHIKVTWLIGPSPRHFTYGKYGEEIPEWAIDLSLQQNNETFISFVKELIKPKLVLNEGYLKINSKPVLYIWDEGAFFNQRDSYQAIKNWANHKIGSDLYIIADWIPRIPTLPDDEYVRFLINKYRGEGLKIVDAFTGWIGFHIVGQDTRQYVDNYNYYYERQLKVWKEFTEEWGKQFIVTVTPGFDNSYSWGSPQIPLPRGKEKFEQRLKIGVKYLDKSKPWIKIDTWNDWGEWSYIEPSVNEGFEYLEVLKNILISFS